MKKIKVASLVRIVLTLLLIYGTYTEAGIYTALCFLFMFINSELTTLAITRKWIG